MIDDFTSEIPGPISIQGDFCPVRFIKVFACCLEIFLREPTLRTPCVPLNASKPHRIAANGRSSRLGALKELVPKLLRLNKRPQMEFTARLVCQCECSDGLDTFRKERR